MEKPKKGRKVALVAGLALVVLSVAMVGTYWGEIGFFLNFERLGRNAQGYPEYRHRQTGIVFVGLSGGTFDMGSPETEAGREENEGPVHKVTLSPFLPSASAHGKGNQIPFSWPPPDPQVYNPRMQKPKKGRKVALVAPWWDVRYGEPGG